MYLLLGAVLATSVVLVGIGYWLVHARSAQEGRFQSFRCPGCGQKLRYLTEKAGRIGICPRCKARCTFPATTQNAEFDENSPERIRVRVGQVLREAAHTQTRRRQITRS
jgi:hypothetical protein